MSSQPLRVIHIFAYLCTGGAENRTMDVYRYINRDKIQFDFIKMNNIENDFENEILSLGGRIFEVTHPRTSLIKHIHDLYRVFRYKGPFLAVHSHTSYHSAIILAIAYAAGIKKRVCHARTTSTKQNKTILLSLIILLSRMLIKLFSTSRLAISTEAAHFLYGKRSTQKKKTSIVPNAINLDSYDKVKDISIESVKLSLGIQPNIIVIGHVGRFSSMKNHVFLLKILSEMKKIIPNICLVCVGDGELKKDIEEKARQLEIESNIKFLGERNDIPYVMRSFDVFAFPSIWEGLGGAVIEAQASGVSCVVSEIIPKETDMGLDLIEYISLSDIKKWIEALISAMKNERPEFNIIKNAFYLKGFTLENSCKCILNSYGIEEEYY